MIAFAPWQGLLDGLGWVVAQIYSVIPNFGVTIIVLTVLIRLVLLPLGIRQIRSMQHMQVIQPKVKQIQTKYKGNKQRQQEEIMKLYREYGVNPFSGCWPVLLQFPILIAMYSVIRAPVPYAPEDRPAPGVEFKDNYNPMWREEFYDGRRLSEREWQWIDANNMPDVFRYTVRVVHNRTGQVCEVDPGVVNDWP